jgi:hypothetical protein
MSQEAPGTAQRIALTAVELGRESSVTGRSGRDALEVTPLAYRSLRAGELGREIEGRMCC